jgi:hypothetical protein
VLLEGGSQIFCHAHLNTHITTLDLRIARAAYADTALSFIAQLPSLSGLEFNISYCSMYIMLDPTFTALRAKSSSIQRLKLMIECDAYCPTLSFTENDTTV